MQCNKCKAQIPDESTFCPYCGEKTNIKSETLPAEQEKTLASDKNGNRWKAILLPIVCILSVAVIALGVILYTVIDSGKTRAITFDRQNMEIKVGQEKVLEVKFTPEDAQNQKVDFIVADDSIVELNGSSIKGLKEGSTRIAVFQNGVQYGMCSVNVVDVQPTRMWYSEENIDGYIGRETDLTPRFFPKNTTNFDVQYTIVESVPAKKDSTDPIATLEGNKLLCNAEGTVTIEADHKVTGIKDTCTVTIKPVTLSSISVDIPEKMSIGDSVELAASFYPKDVTNTDISWSSSNTGVASIKDGVLTANKEGETKITVKHSSGITGELTVTVSPVEATGIKLNFTSKTIEVGQTYQLKATITPKNTTDQKVTWTSNNEKRATVSKDGVVTAKGTGTVTITATTSNGLTAKCKFEIDPAPVDQKNGFIDKPSGTCEAPMKVNAPYGESVYCYFKNTSKPSNSFSMFVKAGTSCEVDVPIGTYHFYYCSGKTWYGKDAKFGDDTSFFGSDDLVTTYIQGNYVYGSEITLYLVSNGNFDADPISENEFPG